MELTKGHLYHVFNQGNNHQKIFFKSENYLFFLDKVRKHILPYADILAWCLPDSYREPNHFHLMILVNEEEIDLGSETMTQSHRITKTKSHHHFETYRHFLYLKLLCE